MSLPDWNVEDAWDVLYLGGTWIPGVARVHVTLPSGLDVQKPQGGKGASIADDGAPPATLTIEIEFVDNETLNDFARVVPLLRPVAKGKARDPLEITHPNAQLWGIDVVTIADISSPSPSPGGSMIITINAVQWFPAPTPAKKPAKKPKSGSSGEQNQDWSNVDALIDDLKPSKGATP